MAINLSEIISDLHITAFPNYKVVFLFVKSPQKGEEIAKKILYRVVDKKTLLLLSGGSTPKALYRAFAKEGKLRPGAVGMVDERYGESFQNLSNEKMIQDTGAIDYLAMQNIPFHPMLQKGISRENTALQYDETIRYLLNWFPKSVAILGIGVDGHLAGIAPNRPDFTNHLFDHTQQNLFVGEFKDPKPMSYEGSNAPPNGFGERITLTFKALEQVDLMIVLSFGKSKKKAIAKMLETGSEEDVPARFFTRREISKKTLFITDQKV